MGRHYLCVKVILHAARSELAGWEGETLRVRLRATPEKGQANEALLALLAARLHLAKTQIALISGRTSRRKKVCITGLSKEELEQRLQRS
jgi:uncharacterized protein YggU (UPF0235/DUF167 family)